MPMYDYQCKDCGKVFTQQQSYNQHDRQRTVKCPHCGGRKTRQLVAAPHVRTSKKS